MHIAMLSCCFVRDYLYLNLDCLCLCLCVMRVDLSVDISVQNVDAILDTTESQRNDNNDSTNNKLGCISRFSANHN